MGVKQYTVFPDLPKSQPNSPNITKTLCNIDLTTQQLSNYLILHSLVDIFIFKTQYCSVRYYNTFSLCKKHKLYIIKQCIGHRK